MNKSELIDNVAAGSGVSKAEAGKAMDAWFDLITDALKQGNEVALGSWGTFSVKDRAEKTVKHPQTGEDVKVPAAKVPKFKAGEGLKAAVN